MATRKIIAQQWMKLYVLSIISKEQLTSRIGSLPEPVQYELDQRRQQNATP